MEFILPAIKGLTYIAIAMIVIGAAVLLGLYKGKRSPLNYIIGSVVCITAGIFLLTVRESGKIIVEKDRLILKAILCKAQTIEVNNVKRAWIEDLKGSQWRPKKKKSGTSAGDTRTGWFILQNGRKGYLVLQGEKALCLETEAEHVFLAGTTNFEEFLTKTKIQSPNLSRILDQAMTRNFQ